MLGKRAETCHGEGAAAAAAAADVLAWARSAADVDVVVGFVLPAGARFDEATMAYDAGAFAADERARDAESSWREVASELAAHSSAAVRASVDTSGVRPEEWVDVDDVFAALSSGRRGVLMVRLDARVTGGLAQGGGRPRVSNLVDGLVASTWRRAHELTKGRALVLLSKERRGGDGDGDALPQPEAVARRALQQITYNSTQQYVTMVPEVFAGLVLFVLSTLALVMFFCCCLAGIEGPPSFAKQLPARGKEWN